MNRRLATIGFLATFIVVGTALTGQAWWQATSAPEPPGKAGRYSIERTDDGMLLLDTASGDTWRLENDRWKLINREMRRRQQQNGIFSTHRQWARVSPFTRVECLEDDEVRVEYEGKLYFLVSLDGFRTHEILASARRQFEEEWERRFVEDLVEVLEGMGHSPQDHVELVLREADGTRRTIDRAAMTHENRQSARAFHHLRGC